MDRQGKKLVHTNIQHNDFAYFLKLVAPYRHDLTVCCECLFGWSWLADACQAAGLTLVAVRKDPTRSTCAPSTAAKRKTTASTPRLSYCRLVKGTVASAGKINLKTAMRFNHGDTEITEAGA